MATSDINIEIVEKYFLLLKNMSFDNKVSLISRLTDSLKKESDKDRSTFYKAFGAWDEAENTKELINTIKGSRNFDRKVEEF